jgi:hypothetical protein
MFFVIAGRASVGVAIPTASLPPRKGGYEEKVQVFKSPFIKGGLRRILRMFIKSPLL